MSKSNASTKNTATTKKNSTASGVVRRSRNITRYTFEYQRDRVSRQAGVSYFRVNGEDGESLDMTIQEAQSLYNFLGKVLNNS